MQFSEKEFETYVYDELEFNDGDVFNDHGIPIHCMLTPNKVRWYRQLNLSPYGIADIVGISRDCGVLIVDVIELKITKSELSHFEQVLRYKTAIRHILRVAGFKGSVEVNAWLFVQSFDEGRYIQNHSPVDVVEYTFSLRGFEFKHHAKHAGWFIKSAEVTEYNYKKFIHDGRL